MQIRRLLPTVVPLKQERAHRTSPPRKVVDVRTQQWRQLHVSMHALWVSCFFRVFRETAA